MASGTEATGGGSAIVLTRTLSGSPAAVWQALTQADAIAVWWGDHVSLEAVVGGAFREVWRDDDGRTVITSGRVTLLEPPRLLSLSWKDADWPVETTVTWQVDEVPGGASLELTHAGWEGFSADRAERLRAAHAAGWNLHLDSLADYLATGRP